MVDVINCTSHQIDILDDQGVLNSYPKTEYLARVSTYRSMLGAIGQYAITFLNVEGNVYGLPGRVPDTLTVTSVMVLEQLQYSRPDVVAPGPVVRDNRGKVAGYNGFAAGAAYRALAQHEMIDCEGVWTFPKSSTVAPQLANTMWKPMQLMVEERSEGVLCRSNSGTAAHVHNMQRIDL